MKKKQNQANNEILKGFHFKTISITNSNPTRTMQKKKVLFCIASKQN